MTIKMASRFNCINIREDVRVEKKFFSQLCETFRGAYYRKHTLRAFYNHEKQNPFSNVFKDSMSPLHRTRYGSKLFLYSFIQVNCHKIVHEMMHSLSFAIAYEL